MGPWRDARPGHTARHRGQIVGVGIHHGEFHAFLLTPAGKDDRLIPAPGGKWALHVRNGEQADAVSVEELGADTGGGDPVEITHNGTTTTFGKVVGAVFETGKGDDTVSFTGTSSAGGDIDNDLGSSDDTATQEKNELAKSLRLMIDGGGDDIVSLLSNTALGPFSADRG